MLVIVEGPDGTGKTTLVKELCEHYNYLKVNDITKDTPSQFRMWNILMEECVKSYKKYVIDRCFLSDWAYRLVKNDSFRSLDLYEISSLLNRPDVIYVFCNNDNAYTFAKNRGEYYIKSKEEHDKITNSYNFIKDTMLKFTNVKVIDYDFTKNNMQDLIDLLKV